MTATTLLDKNNFAVAGVPPATFTAVGEDTNSGSFFDDIVHLSLCLEKMSSSMATPINFKYVP